MIIDTDVVIRYLTGDDESKADRFEKFLNSGEKGFLTDLSLAEIYWTLRSFYNFEKDRVYTALESLINNDSIQCQNYNLLSATISIARDKNISFVDAYNAAFALTKNGRIMSYDKGYEKVSGITRVEP